MVAIGDLVEDATVPAEGYLLVMTKVALEDGSEIGFGLKKDGSETLFVTMFTDSWSVDVPESLKMLVHPTVLLNGKMVSLQHPVPKTKALDLL